MRILILLVGLLTLAGCRSAPQKTTNETVATKPSDPRIRSLQQRIAQNPNDANAFAQLGYLYGQQGDTGKELEYYNKAVAIEPRFNEVYYNMACVYASRGEKAKALQSLRRAFENGFRSRDIIEKDEDLASLRNDPEYERLMGQYF